MSANSIIIDIIQNHVPDTIGIYLFGSQTDETARDDSDYDIAFLTIKPAHLDPVFMFDLANTMGKALSGNVDLINLHMVSLDLRFEVVSKGKRIYCGDKTVCDLFEMMSISMYQRFEEERKPVIEAYKKRLSSWQMQ